MADLDALLSPIEEDSPGGRYFRYDPVYDEIKQARHEDPDLPQGEWKRERKVADWGEVVRLTTEVIEDQSKDLQVAAWLTEARLRTEGFKGLEFGLTLLRRLQEEFWDEVHPQLEEEDDLEFRAVPLEWVGQYLEPAVQSVPLNQAGHDFVQYRESRRVGTEEQAEKDSSKKEARAQAIAEGKLTAEDFDEAFDDTPKAWYKELKAGHTGARDALRALDEFCTEAYGDVAPSFLTLREALEEVGRVVDRLLATKLEQDPDPPEEEAEQAPDEEAGAEGTAEAEGAEGATPASTGGGAPASTSRSREPTSWEDAAEMAGTAAAFMRKERPTDPASYLMLRGLRWGELRVGDRTPDPRLLEAPPTKLRTRLKSLLLDGEWDELVEAGEELMATPYGRGWLDLQRYVLTALAELGGEYESVAAAIRQEIRSLLVDLPDLLEMTLMDDSPTANRETLEWLQEGIMVGLDEEREAAQKAAVAADGRRGSRSDARSMAMTHVRSGNPQKAIRLLLDAATREDSARERFLRRSEATQIMVQEGMESVALPILRQMMDQVERHELEDWEAGETVARTMALLYTCMERLGEDPGLKEELYLRICRLDPMQGMSLGSGGAAEGSATDEAREETDGDAGAE